LWALVFYDFMAACCDNIGKGLDRLTSLYEFCCVIEEMGMVDELKFKCFFISLFITKKIIMMGISPHHSMSGFPFFPV